jgi:uncharacterized protein YbjT (DUF2867 family)
LYFLGVPPKKCGSPWSIKMKIAVFGAGGGTGREVVRQAHEQGHEVTAFVRDPAKAPLNEGARLAVGDARDATAVEAAIRGQDAVVCTLGGSDNTRAEGTATIIKAMEALAVPRLVVVSAIGTGDSYETLPLFMRALVKTALRGAYADHEAQEALVRTSNLAWVIVRPAGLSDGPASGSIHVEGDPDFAPGRMTRADLAAFVLQQVTDDTYLHQAVSVS